MAANESTEARQQSPNVLHARRILRGQEETSENILKLAKKLKAENAFRYAWKILARARSTPIADADLRLKLAQEQALCTYKDPDLPANERLIRALEILQDAEDLPRTTNQETLGLVGAIFKRRWEVDGQKQHLERSLAYYRRGYEQGAAKDQGYTGINTALVLDLLADEESQAAEEAGATSESAKSRREEAHRIREDLITVLPPLPDQPGMKWLNDQWWFMVTIAEAYFGLRRYDDARPWLRKARDLPTVSDWEFASTARQLALIARLHEEKDTDFDGTPAWEVLKDFLGGDVTAVRTVFAGKIGLALSGGGFRASLFHIGVLARLAELDMLRHIEVLSCVSGGAIIGAHYYLALRKLLQDKDDSQITQQDYLDLVARVQHDFLAGVQRNIRMRVMASWWTNVKMIFSPTYSRTDRVGELYESEIFSRVHDGGEKEKRWLNGLYVTPKGPTGVPLAYFKPKYDNWRRRNKVPTLILNATTLNTGHNWQFTASWMGESPASIDPEVDANDRLRRMYYGEAPQHHRHVRLGRAVGASSCVPGLFEPIVFKNLYPDRTVRLVDGGVHDNQGIVGLLEQDCTVLLVSDASGQMESQAAPSKSELGVLMRSNSILQARVRGAGFSHLKTRRRSSLLRGLMFLHLKQDLDGDPVDWVDTEDPYEGSEESRPASRRGPLTSYGIQKDVQRLVAGLRTDLDSFTDGESYALMTSGYRMTEHDFPRSIDGFPVADQPIDWPFLRIEQLMRQKDGSGKLRRMLEVGASIPFKIWILSKPLLYSAIVLLLGLAAGFFWLAWTYPTFPLLTITLGMIGGTAVVALATALVGKNVVRIVRFQETLKQIAIGVVMATVGWLVALIHLHIFDKIFLQVGKISRLTKP